MKIAPLFLIVCALSALLSSGCSTTRGTIEAASTKFTVQTAKNKSMSITLPKEMDTTKLRLEIDPSTGKVLLTADTLKASSAQIIESAGAAQAQSIAEMSKAIASVVPILAQVAAASIAPENSVATAALNAAK